MPGQIINSKTEKRLQPKSVQKNSVSTREDSDYLSFNYSIDTTDLQSQTKHQRAKNQGASTVGVKEALTISGINDKAAPLEANEGFIKTENSFNKKGFRKSKSYSKTKAIIQLKPGGQQSEYEMLINTNAIIIGDIAVNSDSVFSRKKNSECGDKLLPSTTQTIAEVEKISKTDSLNTKTDTAIIETTSLDSTHQNKSAKKNKRGPQLFLSGLYGNGSSPLKCNSYGAELSFLMPIGKKFSVSTAVSAAKIKINETQVHENVKRIFSSPGTTFIVVDKSTTVFKPSNGTMAAVALSVGYKTGKWRWSAGLQGGIVINGENIKTSFVDTFYSYTTATLPAGTSVGGGIYNPDNFNGKHFLSANIGTRFHFGRWRAGFYYSRQLWNIKVEGITEERKKRAGISLLAGFRL